MDHSRWITRLFGWAAGIFHEVEVAGRRIPDGPVLVVANHPNALLDPILIFRVAGRPTRPLAKAPLFEQALLGTLLRGLGGLPVYRKQDDPALMQRNDQTFQRAIDSLAAGDAVQIYPEGTSHSAPALAPLRTGAARIALGAEAQADWRLGLRIVPIGLTYTRKTRFRGKVLASIGEPFGVDDLRAAWDVDPQQAVRTLTARILHALEAVTLNTPSDEDTALIDVAERMYAREKGLASWREREPMAERMPRMQAFARGIVWLHAAEPEQYTALAQRVRRYRRKLALLRVDEGDVPVAYSPSSVIAWIMRYSALLAIGVVPALVGAVAWYPVWLSARLSVEFTRPEHESIATYKLAGAILSAPLVWLVHIGIAGWVRGSWAAVAVAVLTPLCGLATLGWQRIWHRVREDASLFAALVGRRDARLRIAEERAALVRAFDDVIARMDAERGRAPQPPA